MVCKCRFLPRTVFFFFATDPLLFDLVLLLSLLSVTCYQNQHPKVQTTKPKEKMYYNNYFLSVEFVDCVEYKGLLAQ